MDRRLCKHCDEVIGSPVALSKHLFQEHDIRSTPIAAMKDHTRSADDPVEAP